MIKICLAATAVLLASAGAASSQSLIQCLDPTGLTCEGGSASGGSLGTAGSGSGSSLSGPASGSQRTLGTAGSTSTPGAVSVPSLGGSITPSLGTFQNQGTTSAIPQPPTPQGMPALVVPNNPLGTSFGQTPFTGSTSVGGSQNSFGNSGTGSPGIGIQ